MDQDTIKKDEVLEMKKEEEMHAKYNADCGEPGCLILDEKKEEEMEDKKKLKSLAVASRVNLRDPRYHNQ